MNWGYSDDGPEISQEPWCDERYPLQLYARLVDGSDLEGKDVLDVSSGRGGGLAFLTETHGAHRAVGVDYAFRNVEFCRRRWAHWAPRLRFVQGRAERLPVPDASVDVVLSVEASHCYADLSAFVAEANRVLRPGGLFGWTDFAVHEAVGSRRRLLAESFKLLEDRDITDQVLAAMALDRPRRLSIIRQHASAWLRPALRVFAAADDRVQTVTHFRTGRWRYFLFRSTKRTAEQRDEFIKPK